MRTFVKGSKTKKMFEIDDRQQLGKGSYGEVFRCYESSNVYAIKVNPTRETSSEMFVNELQVLSKMIDTKGFP